MILNNNYYMFQHLRPSVSLNGYQQSCFNNFQYINQMHQEEEFKNRSTFYGQNKPNFNEPLKLPTQSNLISFSNAPDAKNNTDAKRADENERKIFKPHPKFRAKV